MKKVKKKNTSLWKKKKKRSKQKSIEKEGIVHLGPCLIVNNPKKQR